MRIAKYIFCTAWLLCSSFGSAPARALIPTPLATKPAQGHFTWHEPLAVSFDLPDSDAHALADCLAAAKIGHTITGNTAGENYLHFELSTNDNLPASGEGYRLSVAPRGITIQSRGTAGLFYGLQTLLQLRECSGHSIPAQELTDAPRFVWRGQHLDVSRHFFDTEFVKKQLRMMASLKLNRLHWHLTDGAGWRIAIDRYPLLTEVAAWRPAATWLAWTAGGRGYCRRDDPGAYGGFYTKEEIREVVAYANSRHITVIPEIEMPGHSDEVLAVYPQLSCTGKPSGGEFCIGNEETFEFLENVLTEVMELFPSEYIHIGGDEASAAAWAECPKCRACMKREGLKTASALQGYAVRRVERFLHSHGRKLLGWDEILADSLPHNAAIMSWRGEQSGRTAAASGHPVVMTPNSHCYFDSYQDNPEREPQAMSGYLPLRKVYAYDPAPAEMPGRENVLGVQAELWAEYIPTPEQIEYMLYPRMFALAEVAWSLPEKKNYEDFHRRALLRTEQARRDGYAAFDLAREFGERTKSLVPMKHLASGCAVTYATPWRTNYPAAGSATLTDGERGSWSYSTRWQGFLDSDVDVTIDLGAVKRIRSISADFIQWYSAWIWLPERVEITASDDGRNFRPLATLSNDYSPEEHRPEYRSFEWSGDTHARYVRYHALSNGRSGGWLFTDEISIN